MDAINLDFVKALKAKFEKKSHEYLCHCCPTFKSLWQTNEIFSREFCKLAKEFLSVNKYTFEARNSPSESSNCLFYSTSAESDHLNREIRLDFLNWLIKKLER